MRGRQVQLEQDPRAHAPVRPVRRAYRKGKQPSCVHHCLAGVMQYGTVEELAKELEEKPNQVLFVPKPYRY